jgi:L-asparaginase
MNITFVQVGGTIDKDYPQGLSDHGYAFKIGEPAIIEILERATPLFNFDVVRLMQQDSLDMTNEDRESVKDLVQSLETDKVVITHGTDTIGLTAETLADISGKTIVLTGAMMPERFRESDADFNVGMAVAAAQKMPHGVYVVLHGMLSTWEEFTN